MHAGQGLMIPRGRADDASDPMHDAPHPDIRVEPSFGGTRYVLPRRELGRERWAAVILILLGVVFVGLPLGGVVGVLGGGWFAIVGALAALPFTVVGAVLAALGLTALRGHQEVEFTRDRIRVIERVGPLHWSWTRPLTSITNLAVVSGVESKEATARPTRPTGNLRVIRARCERGKPLWIAPGYPRETVVALAAAIAERCAEPSGAKLLDDGPLTVEMIEFDPWAHASSTAGPPPTRPTETDIVIEERADGVTVTVPPAGVRRGSKGLFTIGLVWCIFMTVFSGASIGVPLASGQAVTTIVPFVLFGLLFWCIGLGMLLGAINMGRRQVIIDVVGDTLLLTRKSLRGLRQTEWRRDELTVIRRGESGMSVNNVPVMELQIVGRDDRNTGLLSQRTNAELEWIASLLSAALWPTEADHEPLSCAADAA